MAEDRLLEFTEVRARIQPELVAKHSTRPPQRGKRVGLPSCLVEGGHQLRAEAFPERVLCRQRFELGHEIGAQPKGEIGVDSQLERPDP